MLPFLSSPLNVALWHPLLTLIGRSMCSLMCQLVLIWLSIVGSPCIGCKMQTLSSAHDSDFEPVERPTVLFEGGRRDAVCIDAPILFDSAASTNFVSPRLLRKLAVCHSSATATLHLADDSSAPIFGRVKLRLTCNLFLAQLLAMSQISVTILISFWVIASWFVIRPFSII